MLFFKTTHFGKFIYGYNEVKNSKDMAKIGLVKLSVILQMVANEMFVNKLCHHLSQLIVTQYYKLIVESVYFFQLIHMYYCCL